MIKRFLAYLGKYKKYIFICIFMVLGEVICELMMPVLMARIVDKGIPQKSVQYIVVVGVQMVVLAVVAIGFGTFNMKFSSEASQGFGANVRKSVFDKVQRFSFSNIDRFSTASLVIRLTNDITQLQLTMLMSLRLLLRAPLMMVAALVFAISINARLSIVIFIAIPVLATGIALVIRTAERLFAIMQKRLDALNETVQENLIAIRVVKAFVREAHEKLKFKKVNDALTESALNAGYLVSLMMPLMIFVLNVATIAVIWFGGKMTGLGEMGAGELISYISYMIQILISVMMFSMIFIMYARASACGKRILEVLDTEIDIVDKPEVAQKGQGPEITKGKIEFRNVDFRYSTGGEGKTFYPESALRQSREKWWLLSEGQGRARRLF
jgi:ATP-binding cassette subfamily B multidrug efflux pump